MNETVEAYWNRFFLETLPDGMPQQQVEELKAVFYAGATAALNLVVNNNHHRRSASEALMALVAECQAVAEDHHKRKEGLS